MWTACRPRVNLLHHPLAGSVHDPHSRPDRGSTSRNAIVKLLLTHPAPRTLALATALCACHFEVCRVGPQWRGTIKSSQNTAKPSVTNNWYVFVFNAVREEPSTAKCMRALIR
jgi:hypothetical protein